MQRREIEIVENVKICGAISRADFGFWLGLVRWLSHRAGPLIRVGERYCRELAPSKPIPGLYLVADRQAPSITMCGATKNAGRLSLTDQQASDIRDSLSDKTKISSTYLTRGCFS